MDFYLYKKKQKYLGGFCMNKKMRRALSMLLSFSVTAGLISGLPLSVKAEVAAENNYVKCYSAGVNNFDVQGKTAEGGPIQTTCGGGGYTTVIKVGDNAQENFTVAGLGNSFFGTDFVNNGVNTNITAAINGGTVSVTYMVTNTGGDAVTVKVGSYADTQIGNNDGAPIVRTPNGKGMIMSDGDNSFTLTSSGYDFTTLWFGNYGNQSGNVFNDTAEDSYNGNDSALAYSWTIELAAGATATRTAEFSIEVSDNPVNPAETSSSSDDYHYEPPTDPCAKLGHDYYYWIAKEPTVTSDGLVGWRCSRCYRLDFTHFPDANAEGLKVLPAYWTFQDDVVNQITVAPAGGITIDAYFWISFADCVYQAIEARPDLTVSVKFIYEGNNYLVTIPAGTKAESILLGERYAGFAYLGGMFGLQNLQ